LLIENEAKVLKEQLSIVPGYGFGFLCDVSSLKDAMEWNV